MNRMTLARALVATVGIVMPYVAASLGGNPYSSEDFLFISAFNTIPWGSILYFSRRWSHPAMLLPPSLLGFGWVAWRHGIGLGIDAQAAFELIWIPIWSLAPIAVGCAITQVMQGHLHRKGRRECDKMRRK
jgi:hypothetical protein